VILITFDTLRADHLGCYGYARPTSPNLDAFSKTADLYSRAAASSPWTVPTHASLLTGKFPFEHGAHTFETKPGAEMNVDVLAYGHTTLAEVLFDEQYDTVAFVANAAFLNPHWQMNRGFSVYTWARLDAKGLNERVFAWLETAGKRPFFLFLNYMDTHRPYNTAPVEGLLETPASRDKGLLDSLYAEVMPGTGPVPADLVRKVVDQYDTAVANADRQFGSLVERLKARGLYDNTLIVVTSDHGEFFGEHHLVEHSKDVYQEVLWVPLLIKNPGQAGPRTVATVTSSVDIPSLVLSRLPRERAARHAPAFPYSPGNHLVISEIYYTRIKDLQHPVWGHRFDRVRTAVFQWPYKYIHSSDGNHELFHLEDDPAESRNRIGEDPARARRILFRLRQFQAERNRAGAPESRPPLSEEQIELLRSLGYVD
jgi:arylsulfatase A-like enzyme